MKKLLILLGLLSTLSIKAQTGGPPPPASCPPENSATQFDFFNANSTDGCDYEIQIVLLGPKPAYATQCPIGFPAGYFPLVLHQFNLPVGQTRIRNVFSFSHPVNTWYEVAIVINNTGAGMTVTLPLQTFFEDMNGQPQGNTVIAPPVCGPPKVNTVISSFDGHSFVIFDQ